MMQNISGLTTTKGRTARTAHQPNQHTTYHCCRSLQLFELLKDLGKPIQLLRRELEIVGVERIQLGIQPRLKLLTTFPQPSITSSTTSCGTLLKVNTRKTSTMMRARNGNIDDLLHCALRTLSWNWKIIVRRHSTLCGTLSWRKTLKTTMSA